MKINILDPIDKEIFFKNTYEKKQIKILVDNIKCYENAIFVDIGANKGIYSLTLAKKFKNLKIYAYEPVLTTFKSFKTDFLDESMWVKLARAFTRAGTQSFVGTR